MKGLIIFFIPLVLALNSFSQYNSNSKTRIHFIGSFNSASKLDTITICTWDAIVNRANMFTNVPHSENTSIAKNGKFDITVTRVSHPVYLYIGYGHVKSGWVPFKTILPICLVEPGDDINLKVELTSKDNFLRLDFGRAKYTFSGKGFEKYNCYYKMQLKESEIQDELFQLNQNHLNYSESDTTKKFQRLMAIVKIQNEYFQKSLSILDDFKSKLSPLVYNIFYANAFGRYNDLKIKGIGDYTIKWHNNKEALTFLKNFDLKYCKQYLKIADATLSKSREYISYLFDDIDISNRIKDTSGNRSVVLDSIFSDIKNDYTSSLRDQLLGVYFMSTLQGNIPHFTENIAEAISIVKNQQIKKVLFQLSKVHIGMKGYDFALQNREGKLIKMSDFKGKIVMIDFWFTGCSACKQFYDEELSKVEEDLKSNENIVFITINIDNSKKTWLNSLDNGFKYFNSKDYIGRYTSNRAVNLWTGEIGDKHPLIKFYNVLYFPQPMLFDQQGELVSQDANLLRFGGPKLLEKTILSLQGNPK